MIFFIQINNFELEKHAPFYHDMINAIYSKQFINVLLMTSWLISINSFG